MLIQIQITDKDLPFYKKFCLTKTEVKKMI